MAHQNPSVINKMCFSGSLNVFWLPENAPTIQTAPQSQTHLTKTLGLKPC
ncbi:hypothetical protein [Alysiella filiformis]|nr:hypothetical protein [Alysiella filiformis]QMT30581.1 hypothetical protein H3L97_07425 [Alysiella filiformis]